MRIIKVKTFQKLKFYELFKISLGFLNCFHLYILHTFLMYVLK